MLFLSLAFSAGLLVILNAVALSHRTRGVGWASLCSLAALVLFFWATVPVLALNALLLLVVGLVCWKARARRRWFVAASLAATVAAFAVVAVPDFWAWDRLKTKYPLESLAPRLACENRLLAASAPADSTLGSAAEAGLARLEARVGEEEQRFPAATRTKSLERLHAGVVQQFIDSPGFGVGRMIHVASPRWLERGDGDEPPVPQSSPPYTPPDLAPATLRPASGPDLLTAHEDNAVAFANVVGFGYVRDREHVAGFRPHGFRGTPQAPQRWRVGTLELVGLLKEAEPVVYQSADFPRMDELSQARSRPPDAFEREALAGLRHGEDLLVEESPGRMRMLGSIRAVSQCLRCHNVQRGELLGAFSYELSPEPSSSP